MAGLLGLGALGYAAAWHERHERHGNRRWRGRDRDALADDRDAGADLAPALGVRAGDCIAAIGADDASVLALARAVGEAGRVHAVALGERRASDLEAFVKQQGASNVFVVLATPDDPRLPEGAIHTALIHAGCVVEGGSALFLDRLRRSLAPGGRVALVGGGGGPWLVGERHRAWHLAQWALSAARLDCVARLRAAGWGRVRLYAVREAA